MRAALVFFALLTAALAADYAPYRWSRDLPKELATDKPASHRTAAEVDALFANHTKQVNLDAVLATLGQPDGFTRQALYSAARGTAEPQTAGGTVRFILCDGGQLLVRTGDFHVIYEAIRYDRKGWGTLLEK
jgi:hypothetical protein